jgi:antitoxin component of RelBE/YafQ-DinJ toxin-antitoxin module
VTLKPFESLSARVVREAKERAEAIAIALGATLGSVEVAA